MQEEHVSAPGCFAWLKEAKFIRVHVIDCQSKHIARQKTAQRPAECNQLYQQRDVFRPYVVQKASQKQRCANLDQFGQDVQDDSN